MRLLYQLTFCWQKFALLFKSYEKILILACNGGLSIDMPLGEGVQIMSHRNHSHVFAKKISEKRDIDYIFENIIGGGGIWQWLVILLIWPIG